MCFVFGMYSADCCHRTLTTIVCPYYVQRIEKQNYSDEVFLQKFDRKKLDRAQFLQV